MTGLNGVQPFAPFGDPVADAANWQAHDPASIVGNLADTEVDLYTSTGLPGGSDLTDPAMVGTVTLEALLHVSNLRSEEHTSELQSLMRTSYAVFCLKKKKKHNTTYPTCPIHKNNLIHLFFWYNIQT